MFDKMALINLNKTPGKSILKTPGTGKKNSEMNKSVRILFTNEEPFSDNQLTANVQNNSEAVETEKYDMETLLLDIKRRCTENELSQEKTKKKKTKQGSDSKSKKNSSSPIGLSEERVLKIPKLQIEPLKGLLLNTD